MDEESDARAVALLDEMKGVEYLRQLDPLDQDRRFLRQNRQAVELAMRLYAAGKTDFLNVLTAQLNLYTTENSLVRSTSSVDTNLIALYKALGGGWETGVALD